MIQKQNKTFMKNIICTLSFLILSQVFSFGQETKRVLFIGNSYIYSNNLPVVLNSLANSNNDTVIHSSSTPGGAQLVQHVVNNTTLNSIRQGNWDYVVIQEQSQKPSFPDAQVAQDVYPYAAQLNDTIEAYNPCGETVFFMTWGRKNGDPQWAPISTFEGMNNRLRNAYLQMTTDNDAICSPVGAAWKVVRDSFPGIELYSPDESHPSYAGTYLAACTFYATMFRKSPVGLSFHGSLSATDAQALQNVAAMVVLDSMSNWSIGAHDMAAGFTADIVLDSVSFTNTTTANTTATYSWDFGDGSQLSTGMNPSHTYDSTGTYTVTLIATDSCGNVDTLQENVTVSVPTSTSQLEKAENLIIDCFPNPTSNEVTIASNREIEEVRMLNSLGEEIFYRKSMKTQKIVLYLSSYAKGVYFISIKNSNSKPILKKLVLQ